MGTGSFLPENLSSKVSRGSGDEDFKACGEGFHAKMKKFQSVFAGIQLVLNVVIMWLRMIEDEDIEEFSSSSKVVINDSLPGTKLEQLTTDASGSDEDWTA
ncbi:hypothetical protein FH972_017860 [Carpinus fangiana]|uniref:Uncharacterized protein n=1 Tax=Carpinus fangiana TaxID=176857 RepID=A0A5N6RNL1_9ROSI|nr:hypothetical protein FH972_017860 [Carpinus fangiana]